MLSSTTTELNVRFLGVVSSETQLSWKSYRDWTEGVPAIAQAVQELTKLLKGYFEYIARRGRHVCVWGGGCLNITRLHAFPNREPLHVQVLQEPHPQAVEYLKMQYPLMFPNGGVYAPAPGRYPTGDPTARVLAATHVPF